MKHCITKALLLLCWSFFQSVPTEAFAPASSAIARASSATVKSTTITTTTTTTTQLDVFRRRQIFGGLRRIVFAGALLLKSSSSSFPKEVAVAAEAPTAGRIVEFQLNNLDGISGKTGTIKIQLRPEWAPRGVARFEELTEQSFWNECRIFRVLPGFVAQFGIHGNPRIQSQWRSAHIPDDPVKVSNKRGTVVFATAGPNTRTSQIFINTRDQGNAFLDKQNFSPIGEVTEGMDIVDRFYAGYGEGAPAGTGPHQGLIQQKGNAYLQQGFPKLSYISKGSFQS